MVDEALRDQIFMFRTEMVYGVPLLFSAVLSRNSVFLHRHAGVLRYVEVEAVTL